MLPEFSHVAMLAYGVKKNHTARCYFYVCGTPHELSSIDSSICWFSLYNLEMRNNCATAKATLKHNTSFACSWFFAIAYTSNPHRFLA